MGAAQGRLRALLAQFFFGQPGNHDRQFVGRQGIGVMQDRGHRQIFTAHRSVDDHLQALYRGEHVDAAPVAARAIVIQD